MKKKFKEQAEEVKLKVKKLGIVKSIILLIMIVATVCAFVLYDYIFGSKSVFDREISQFGFVNNIFWMIPKIIRAIQAVTIILVIATILSLIINKVFVKNKREVTVANLNG